MNSTPCLRLRRAPLLGPTLWLACLLAGAIAAPGMAAPDRLPGPQPTHSPAPGDVGVFFDAQGMTYQRPGTVSFVPFDVFVVAFAPPGGMEAYEFSLTMPAGAIVSQGRVLPLGATDFGAGDDNWIVGTGGICQGLTPAAVLVTYRGMLFLAAVPNDLTLCLSGSQPSSFPSGAPGYLVCNAPGQLQQFASAYPGCAVINPSDGCLGHLAQMTLGVGHETAAPGAPVTLPVTTSGVFHDPCAPKTIPTPVVVTRLEMDLAWDASVATFAGARFPDDGQGAPTIVVTPGPGVATVEVTRTDPPLYEVHEAPGQILMLDFLAAMVTGQTPVAITRLEVDGDALGSAERLTSPGSITTQGVPAESRSFGGLKARWSSSQ